MDRLTSKKILLWLFLILPLYGFAHPTAYNTSINDQIYKAILENRFDDMLLLIKESKDINEETTDGKSVFDAVLVFHNCEAAEVLFQNHIDITKRDKQGLSIQDKVNRSDNRTLQKLLKKYYP
jgi:hypothetical protein